MSIKLNSKQFYKWMKERNKCSCRYLESIRNNQNRPDYILRLRKKSGTASNSDGIIEKLSRSVPRNYFQELLYSAKTFECIMGTVFPHLLPIIEELLYIEWLLYVEPGYPKYRDHLVHMFKVAYVQDQLLSSKIIMDSILNHQFESDHFNEWCHNQEIDPKNWTKDDEKEVIPLAAFLAAIFHDWGYGYYYNNLYRERLSKISSWLPPESDFLNVNTEFFKILSNSLVFQFIKTIHPNCSLCGNEKNKNAYVSGFFRDCLTMNHSIASAFTLLKLIENFKEADALNKKLFTAFHLAAEAIFIHDLTNKDSFIHLNKERQEHFIDSEFGKKNPLAALLILADELSCWNRPRIEPRNSKNNEEIIYSLNARKSPSEIEIIIDTNTIQIKPVYIPVYKKDKLTEIEYNGSCSEFKESFDKNPIFLMPSKSQSNSPQWIGFDINIDFE